MTANQQKQTVHGEGVTVYQREYEAINAVSPLIYSTYLLVFDKRMSGVGGGELHVGIIL